MGSVEKYIRDGVNSRHFPARVRFFLLSSREGNSRGWRCSALPPVMRRVMLCGIGRVRVIRLCSEHSVPRGGRLQRNATLNDCPRVRPRNTLMSVVAASNFHSEITAGLVCSPHMAVGVGVKLCSSRWGLSLVSFRSSRWGFSSPAIASSLRFPHTVLTRNISRALCRVLCVR